MNDTMTSVLGVLAGVLLLAAIVLMFFEVEKAAHSYATRQCACACAELPPPPVAPSGRVFYEGAVKQGGGR